MKMNTSNLHLELLSPQRQDLLNKLIPLSKDFVLGGGTALALQINHRKSFDFDFFSPYEINKNLERKLSEKIQIKSVIYNTGDELTFLDNNGIKTTFLFYYFKTHYQILELNNGLRLYSPKEIAAHKAHTIGRRGEYRDYFDLYTILKNKHSSLKEIIESSEKVYGSLFNSKLFLEQLVYFGDLLSFEIIPVGNQQLPSRNKVKQFLEEEVKKYLKS